MLNDYDTKFNISEFSKPVFFRTENVSLKSGQNGVGPYYNFTEIIQSLVSCGCTHTI